MTRGTDRSQTPAWWARHGRRAYVDPHAVRWADTPVNPAAVAYYRRHPDGRYERDHDGDPCVVRTPSGQLEGRNGKHRGIAAMQAGRKLKVLLIEATGKSWWSW